MALNGVALVTGAGSGLGRDAALGVAAAGATTVLCADLNPEAASKTAQELRARGIAAEFIALDVTQEESVMKAFAQAVGLSPTGRIDYFVNAAGTGPGAVKSVDKMSLKSYRQMDEVHNIGAFLCLREAARIMLKQDLRAMPLPNRPIDDPSKRNVSRGTIVVVTSIVAKGGGQALSSYVASKHAAEGLVKAAALEYAQSGIRINAVAPVFVAGPTIMEIMNARPGLMKRTLKDHPMGRLVESGEVADAIVFLLSASASYLNGTNLAIDGGLLHTLAQPMYRQEIPEGKSKI